jgi:hypothetical protein
VLFRAKYPLLSQKRDRDFQLYPSISMGFGKKEMRKNSFGIFFKVTISTKSTREQQYNCKSHILIWAIGHPLSYF